MSSHNTTEETALPPNLISTDHLIVGAGPSGASLACFLAQHSLSGILISAAPGTTTQPGAHISNAAALECLRDIGLEESILKVASPSHTMQHTRWCYSMAGEEFGRVYAWGNDPKRRSEYEAASPCGHVDLPQTELEPILVKKATDSGFSARFKTTFLSFTEEEGGRIVSTVRDGLTGLEYRIRSKYLYAADGGRSQIVRQLDLPLIKQPGQGLAINVMIEADLSKLMDNRTGNLHMVMQPDQEHPAWGWWAVLRMVKPWNRWIVGLLTQPGYELREEPTRKEYLERVKQLIGDDSIKVEILDVTKWYINEVVAEHYSRGNIFCLGDAVHRHPPFNGLGSNTCIQDAYNLAWKISYVEKGLASPTLLDSYSLERQPVGQAVVTRANQAMRDQGAILEALAMLNPDVTARQNDFAQLSAVTPEGAFRRKRLNMGLKGTEKEFHGLGIELNQHYVSKALFLDDESERPATTQDPTLHYQITTYPGSRLPHAWLNTKVPGKRFSTTDLAGHGKFCLLTGLGGNAWKDAAREVGEGLRVDIVAYSIGWNQDYEDMYLEWEVRREVEEDGCVLVRPDRFVAWRSTKMVGSPGEKLKSVMKHVLGL